MTRSERSSSLSWNPKMDEAPRDDDLLKRVMRAVFDAMLPLYHEGDDLLSDASVKVIAQAAIDASRAWQPIGTAPRNVEVLLLGPLRDGSGLYQEVCLRTPYQDRWTVEWMHNTLAPTHWMPLPEPPE